MQDESEKLEIFTRRAFMLTSGKAVLASILALRLFDLQVLRGDELGRLAELNKNKLIWIKPVRGKIFDKFGEVMADNKTEYNLTIDKESLIAQEADAKTVFKELGIILHMDDEQLEHIFKKYKITATGKELIIKDKLSRDEVLALEFYSYKLPGCYIETDFQRNYYHASCTNIIGYVASQDNNADTPDSRLIKTGKTGVELKFDYMLRGKLGYKEVEVDSRGVIKKERSIYPEENGQDLQLSISNNLQKKLYEAFAGQNGTAVVMNGNNGDILALVSVPNYDANIITDGLTNEEWQKLTSDPGLPLINKAISAAYPPGSLFKIATALAFLESGHDPKMRVFCSGASYLGKTRFGCWKKEGHGSVDLEMALEQSCNCYFYKAGEITGIEKIKYYADMLGIGQKSFDQLPFVSSGLMPSPSWKKKKYNQSWSMGDTYNTAIGQGFVLTSILQLAVMLSRATTGNKIIPTLMNDGEKKLISLGFQQKNLEIIQNALYRVVNSEYGTARKYKTEEYILYGKTGTAQVISKKGRNIDLSSEATLWQFKNHGLFLGGAKKDTKNICMAVLVEHLGAGTKTIPIAKEILEEALKEV